MNKKKIIMAVAIGVAFTVGYGGYFACKKAYKKQKQVIEMEQADFKCKTKNDMYISILNSKIESVDKGTPSPLHIEEIDKLKYPNGVKELTYNIKVYNASNKDLKVNTEKWILSCRDGYMVKPDVDYKFTLEAGKDSTMSLKYILPREKTQHILFKSESVGHPEYKDGFLISLSGK